MKDKIPNYGSITRPVDTQEGIKELKDGLLDWANGDIDVTYVTSEFTSVCPTTGQPDFYDISVRYCPIKKYIESKRMKFYLWAFREYGIHCEHLANKVAVDIFNTIAPKYVEVTVSQKPRGGLGLTAIKRIDKKGE